MKGHAILIGILVGAFIGTGTASAQNVGGGAKIGVNFATVTGDLDEGTSKSMRTGLVAGGFLTVGMTDMVAFQPEVLYSQEGVKQKFTEGSTSIEGTARIGVVHNSPPPPGRAFRHERILPRGTRYRDHPEREVQGPWSGRGLQGRTEEL
jgi:hypothetical protein